MGVGTLWDLTPCTCALHGTAIMDADSCRSEYQGT